MAALLSHELMLCVHPHGVAQILVTLAATALPCHNSHWAFCWEDASGSFSG